MFSYRPEGRKTLVVSKTSSESKAVDDIVQEGDQVFSTGKTLNHDSKGSALLQSSSKKKVKRQNVKCTSTKIKRCELEEIRRRYQIPSSVKMFLPKKEETADNPPNDRVAVYKIMLECGLRLPANEFVNEIMAIVGRAPAEVTYNSWLVLTAFQVGCHVAGMKPSLELFNTMYRINCSNKDYVYFSQRGNKNITLLNLPKRIRRWERYFFFVSANAFGKEVPKAFSGNTATFKCDRPDIEMEYKEFKRKFPQRLLYGAYLDEKVLLRCNIYKDSIKRPKEGAYNLLLKVNDAFVKTAVATKDQQVLKLLKEESLRSGKSDIVDASDDASEVSVALNPSEPDSKVTNVILSAIPLGNESAALETNKSSFLDAESDEDVEIIDVEKFMSYKKKPLSNASCSKPASAWPETSTGKIQVDRKDKLIAPHPKKKRTSLKTLLYKISDDVGDEEHLERDEMLITEQKRELVKQSSLETSCLEEQDELDSISVQLEAILDKADQSLQKTSEHMERDRMLIKEQKRELPNESSLEASGVKEQDGLESISVQLDAILDKADQSLQKTSEHMERDRMLIKGQKKKLPNESSLEASGVKEQDELDSISVQLDAILEKGAQSLQETYDHRNQMTTILASLEYCQLGASLEKAAQQVSNLRGQVNLLHSRHAKLEMCLKNYNQQVSDCKNNIIVLNSVRAQLQTFGLRESYQEVARLANQVGQLNSIHAQLEESLERCRKLETSLKISEQELSIMEDQVKGLLVQNHRSSREDSQLQLKSLKAELDQLEISIKKTDQNVGQLKIIVQHMTTILGQLVVGVEQANCEFKISSASTKSLYEKAIRQCLRS